MFHNLSKLFTGVTFLFLKSKDLTLFQWLCPLVLTVLFQLVYYFLLPVKPSYLGDDGLLSNINQLLSTLIGFYIAAVAAIASFNNGYLDSQMKGRTPELVSNGVATKLTRRRFLCVLFGYCAFLSIFLYLGSLLVGHIIPALLELKVVESCFFWFKLIGTSIYVAAISSLFVTTLLGLHYLIDRMHRV